MMLKPVRETPNAVSFNVDFPRNTSCDNGSKVRERLESESKAAKGPSLTIEKIQEKLQKAQEFRETHSKPSDKVT